jgi:hypothetical protein
LIDDFVLDFMKCFLGKRKESLAGWLATVDQTDIRGLGTYMTGFIVGLPSSPNGRRASSASSVPQGFPEPFSRQELFLSSLVFKGFGFQANDGLSIFKHGTQRRG